MALPSRVGSSDPTEAFAVGHWRGRLSSVSGFAVDEPLQILHGANDCRGAGLLEARLELPDIRPCGRQLPLLPQLPGSVEYVLIFARQVISYECLAGDCCRYGRPLEHVGLAELSAGVVERLPLGIRDESHQEGAGLTGLDGSDAVRSVDLVPGIVNRLTSLRLVGLLCSEGFIFLRQMSWPCQR